MFAYGHTHEETVWYKKDKYNMTPSHWEHDRMVELASMVVELITNDYMNGETLRVDTGCLVALQPSVQYDIPELVRNSFGRLSFDTPHRVKLDGFMQAIDDLGKLPLKVQTSGGTPSGFAMRARKRRCCPPCARSIQCKTSHAAPPCKAVAPVEVLASMTAVFARWAARAPVLSPLWGCLSSRIDSHRWRGGLHSGAPPGLVAVLVADPRLAPWAAFCCPWPPRLSCRSRVPRGSPSLRPWPWGRPPPRACWPPG